MNVNYEYLVSYVARQAEATPSLRALDFGCGDGTVVNALRERDIQCFGAEIFYDAGDFHGSALHRLVTDGIVRAIPSEGTLPFDDGYFDIIFSNQVFEHVERLDVVIGELSRVLRPTGKMYHHFPSREVIREGHFGIPLSHRISGLRTRRQYMLALRLVGLGYHKQRHRGVRAWADHAARYIEDYCFYRPSDEIRLAFSSRYRIAHREIDYIRFRVRGSHVLEALTSVELFAPMWERLFRRMAFMAIELAPR